MKILVTGSKGFVGRNLVAQLNNIKSGKAKFYGDIILDDIFEYDIDSSAEDQYSIRSDQISCSVVSDSL